MNVRNKNKKRNKLDVNSGSDEILQIKPKDVKKVLRTDLMYLLCLFLFIIYFLSIINLFL